MSCSVPQLAHRLELFGPASVFLEIIIIERIETAEIVELQHLHEVPYSGSFGVAEHSLIIVSDKLETGLDGLFDLWILLKESSHNPVAVIFWIVLTVVHQLDLEVVFQVDGHLEEDLPQVHVDGGHLDQMAEVQPDIFAAPCLVCADSQILLEPEEVVLFLQEGCHILFVNNFEGDSQLVLAVFDYLERCELRKLFYFI